jgi:hypothetical protein
MGSTSIHTFRYRRLAAQLRAWREASGQTQRALALKLRKPASYVHKCEVAERKIDPLELMDWIEACDVKPGAALATIQQLRRK